MFKSRSAFLLLLAFLFSTEVMGQYPPPAGQPGSTAIYRDSSAIIAWASYATIDRGYINFVDTTILYNGSNKASYGSYLYASGPSDEYVVSLGDHGRALLSFDTPIMNGSGPDFAVFENSFGDLFLELAFVEVSSDGLRFVRFPSVSLTADTAQVPSFGTLDATKINNLAGKYRLGYGTPFDLEDIKDSAGIDLDNIIYLRIVDVGGCISDPYAVYDSQGHKINDPWPTPFDTGGFDLDAVGVLHNTAQGLGEDGLLASVVLFPNPFSDILTIRSPVTLPITISITDLPGRVVYSGVCRGKCTVSLSFLKPGIYVASLALEDGTSVSRKVVKN